MHLCDNQRVKPAWERHDFATYAAALPGVRRLIRAQRILLICAGISVGVPLLIALTGGPILLMALTPIVTAVLTAASGFCLQRAAAVERLAIARWVIAAERFS
ncbi:hypothetical protein [Microbacterium lemovicicum]|uniref:hypothetical protein n=1 Tax=Microbacterium lemovicicum TaxID=1072463 RepID=UPI000F8C41CF|nr:hypothetical protein [Microbacterium lemovicicum]